MLPTEGKPSTPDEGTSLRRGFGRRHLLKLVGAGGVLAGAATITGLATGEPSSAATSTGPMTPPASDTMWDKTCPQNPQVGVLWKCFVPHRV